jgi:hypothetical protein
MLKLANFEMYRENQYFPLLMTVTKWNRTKAELVKDMQKSLKATQNG